MENSKEQHFKASLLNKSTHFLKKKNTYPKLLNGNASLFHKNIKQHKLFPH